MKPVNYKKEEQHNVAGQCRQNSKAFCEYVNSKHKIKTSIGNLYSNKQYSFINTDLQLLKIMHYWTTHCTQLDSGGQIDVIYTCLLLL